MSLGQIIGFICHETSHTYDDICKMTWARFNQLVWCLGEYLTYKNTDPKERKMEAIKEEVKGFDSVADYVIAQNKKLKEMRRKAKKEQEDKASMV